LQLCFIHILPDIDELYTSGFLNNSFIVIQNMLDFSRRFNIKLDLIESVRVFKKFIINKSYQNYDGIIIIYNDRLRKAEPEKNLEYIEKTKPCLYLFNQRVPENTCVILDEKQSVELLYKHLLSEGHSEIVFYASKDLCYIKKRRAAYLTCKQKYGNNSQKVHLFEKQDKYSSFDKNISEKRKLEHDFKKILYSLDSIDAIMFSNDFEAFQFAQFLEKNTEYYIPKSIAITGFGNMHFYFNTYGYNFITTIDQKLRLATEIGLRLLVDIIRQRENQGKQILISPQLIERISSLKKSYIPSRPDEFHFTNQVQNYIMTKYDEENLAKKISFNLNLNYTYFLTLFKKKFGKTFSEYLNDIRLDQAVEFLKNTNMTVLEILITIGYNSREYFNRLFKEKFNITPSAYRILNHKNQ